MIEVSLNLGSHFGSTWVAVHVFGLLWDAFLRFVQLLGTKLEVLDATWVQLGCNLVALGSHFAWIWSFVDPRVFQSLN